MQQILNPLELVKQALAVHIDKVNTEVMARIASRAAESFFVKTRLQMNSSITTIAQIKVKSSMIWFIFVCLQVILRFGGPK